MQSGPDGGLGSDDNGSSPRTPDGREGLTLQVSTAKNETRLRKHPSLFRFVCVLDDKKVANLSAKKRASLPEI